MCRTECLVHIVVHLFICVLIYYEYILSKPVIVCTWAADKCNITLIAAEHFIILNFIIWLNTKEGFLPLNKHICV